MEQSQNPTLNSEIIIKSLENQIKNNRFDSKEALIDHLVQLRKNAPSELDGQKIQELLALFDSLKEQNSTPLDMRDYRSVGLESQNLIISKKDNRVLKTLEGTSEFTNEFLQAQNEIVANEPDGMTNADTIFNHMADYQKEEIVLLPLNEAISHNNIDKEMLNKIKFFITNIKKDLNPFRIDTEKGIFYNIETAEVYEVRKNEETNQYQIYQGNKKNYGSNEAKLEEAPDTEEKEPELESEKDEEALAQGNGLFKPKKRVRTLENSPHERNAAFTKIGFLIINIITFAILTTMIILLNK